MAEDGSISSRFVSPSRYAAPAIALVSVPVTVTTRPTSDSAGVTVRSGVAISPRRAFSPSRASVPYSPREGTLTPSRRHGDNIVLASEPSSEVSSVISAGDWVAWKKFTAVAAKDFSEGELVNLTWDAVADLLRFYKMTSPIEIAKVQLAWKKKRGLLPSDGADPVFSSGFPDGREGDSTFYIPAAMANSIRSSDIVNTNTSFGSRGGSEGRPSSPRRGGRYVPGYKSPLRWNASPKVDTGMVKRRPSQGN